MAKLLQVFFLESVSGLGLSTYFFVRNSSIWDMYYGYFEVFTFMLQLSISESMAEYAYHSRIIWGL